MNQTIEILQPVIDNASYVDLFWWTFLMLPLIVGIPAAVYWVLLQALKFLRGL